MATSPSHLNIAPLLLTNLIILALCSSPASASSVHDHFLQCLQSSSSVPPFHTPNTSSYSSVLHFSIRNFRFSSSSTRKPDLILTPADEPQVQAAVICSRRYRLHIKIRSGGHDFEGRSYVSDVPFVVLDLINLTAVTVDVEQGTAWAQAGASLGQLYYSIAQKSKTHAFPAGFCPNVGMGGHISGGGYGSLMRKYGLAADNILDAWIVNADGQILNRETMGEDLFWAIRGGGASSFCVVLSWKVKLVPVPPTLTVFRLFKTLEQGATTLVERWQHVAHKLPHEIFSQILITAVNSTQEGQRTVVVTFQSVFLGTTEELIPIMERHFPELGLKREDCTEMSWIQSTLWLLALPTDGPLDVLLDKTTLSSDTFKAKSDYVTKPISELGWEGVWKFLLQEDRPMLLITAYGGRMSEIPESSIPFPHRKANLFSFLQVVYWEDKGLKASRERIDWIRRLNKYLAPHVSKSSYVNYNDLDLGHSKNGTTSYSEAKAWGAKYFNNNFDRLVKVKTMVDPDNFFRNEQSIPTSGKTVQSI